MAQRESLREATFWAPVLGFLAGDAAFAVGDMAEEGAKRAGVPESLIETHEHQTGATLGIFEALPAWRLLLRNRSRPRTRIGYLTIAIVGLRLVSATGHYGGSLAYEHGVNVDVAAAGHRIWLERSPIRSEEKGCGLAHSDRRR